MFFRHFIMLVFLLPWLWRQGRGALRPATFPATSRAGWPGSRAIACYFYAIAHLRLADAVLLNQSMPLFIPLVERAWLGERIPPRLWGVLALGFAGPAADPAARHRCLPACGARGPRLGGLASIAQVGIRRLTRTEPVTRIVFYFGLVASVAVAAARALVVAHAVRRSPGRCCC